MIRLHQVLLLALLFGVISVAHATATSGTLVIAPPSAAELFDASGCRGCHRLDNRGGSRGPALDKVGKRLDAAHLRLRLLWPQSLAPTTSMPVYDHLSEEQINLLVGYLSGLK